MIWQRLGNPKNYCEPFFGSGAVLLARPGGAGHTETINDLDAWVANFWRATAADPEQVAHYADWPVNEADCHARHGWLLRQDEWRAKMRDPERPEFYDAKIAGWWLWGVCLWIGSGWCSPRRNVQSEQIPHLSSAGMGVHASAPSQQLPHLGNAGRGVHRGPSEQLPHLQAGSRGGHRESLATPSQKLPMLAHGARGIHAASLDAPSVKIPQLGNAGRGVHRALLGTIGEGNSAIVTENVLALIHRLRDRMRRVRVACGSWERVMTPAVTSGHGVTGVLLDPPYAEGADDLYGNHDKSISAKVRQWAIENGNNPLLRIAFCGYDGEHEAFPDGWECVAWKAAGGYGSGNGNPHRERIWFSPACLKVDTTPAQRSLF